MVDASSDVINITESKSAKELFPGYYPPSADDRRDAYQHGLIGIDANALLDLYRFTSKARDELFDILEALRPRLFFAHQAVLEFYRNRLTVIEDRLSAAEIKCAEIKQPLNAVIDRIREFANRHQIGDTERDRLSGMVEGLSRALTDAIRTTGTYDLPNEEIESATDEVLKRFENLSNDRIGGPLSEAQYKIALKEAGRRRDERIPPGYADKKLNPELQAGDYILWRQLMDEAAVHKRPVLFITNEQKEDWVLKDSSNRILGPRPELVLEMLQESQVALHTVSVIGLLREARDFLGIAVSSSTIREAESLPKKRRYKFRFNEQVDGIYESLSAADKIAFLESIKTFGDTLISEGLPESLPNVNSIAPNAYMVRWSRNGRAIIRLRPDSDEDFDLVMEVLSFGIRDA